MIKSLCFKTNNKNAINYLQNTFSLSEFPYFHFSKRKFKNYWNIIIHYKGNDFDSFFCFVANCLCRCITNIFENVIFKNIIKINYFYFTDIEQNIIFENCLSYLNSSSSNEILNKQNSLYSSCLDYINNNNKMILDGFINFRIREYIKILDSIVDRAVNKFVIDREYNNFINIVRLYIESKPCLTNKIHLIYSEGVSSLFDEFYKPLKINYETFDNKYLSDISFSINDYSLNTLLSLLPKKLIIHIIDKEDEFINTLKLIFEDRAIICKNCKLCSNKISITKNSEF